MNQDENKWCCAAETPAEVYKRKIHRTLDNTPPHFACYGRRPNIYELWTFGCSVYPITPSPKRLYEQTQ